MFFRLWVLGAANYNVHVAGYLVSFFRIQSETCTHVGCSAFTTQTNTLLAAWKWWANLKMAVYAKKKVRWSWRFGGCFHAPDLSSVRENPVQLQTGRRSGKVHLLPLTHFSAIHRINEPLLWAFVAMLRILGKFGHALGPENGEKRSCATSTGFHPDNLLSRFSALPSISRAPWRRASKT